MSRIVGRIIWFNIKIFDFDLKAEWGTPLFHNGHPYATSHSPDVSAQISHSRKLSQKVFPGFEAMEGPIIKAVMALQSVERGRLRLWRWGGLGKIKPHWAHCVPPFAFSPFDS
jgi:hypothetical protein